MLFELERGVTKVNDIKSINIINRRVVHVKKIKKICISCLLTLCIFIPNIAVFALNIPSDNIAVQSVLVDGIQVTNTPSMVEEGTGFFMNDGSVAICCSHGLPAPSQGVGYYIDRSLGSSYRDGDLWYDTPTDWTFRCLYYADKLERNGVNFGYSLKRIYIAECASRRTYYDTLVWYDTAPYTQNIHNLYNQVVAAAERDEDNISGNLHYENGVVMYKGSNGYGARLAYYRTGNAGIQNLLVYTPDIPLTGYVNLNKTSANPEITNGNSYYSLAGAVYGVYTEWGCYNEVGRLTTDEWGNTNTLELNAGTYYVKELIAPQGYALDDVTVHEVTVTASQTATVYTSDFPQSDPVAILLHKKDYDTNTDVPQGSASLESAEFTVKYFSGLYDTNPEEQGIQPTRTWILKTDENGRCRLDDNYKISGDDFWKNSFGVATLPIGTITIQETKAPEGYLLNPEIFIRQITSDGSAESVNTYNEPVIPETVMKGSVELYKSDDESGKELAGAVYGIYFHDGTEVGRLTTDETGYAKSDLLPYGQYYLQEITAPNGYVLDTAQYPFTIGADGQVITINATDKNQMGQIQGTKTGEVLVASDFRLTEFGMMYAPIYEEQGLPNAVYEIYAKEDIATPEGTVKYTAGQLVETVTTDEQGMFTSKQLYLGTYVIKEKQAPKGYVLDETKYEVTLSYGGQNNALILSPVTLSDERQKVTVSVKKEMEENTVYPNPEAYKDVQFGLYAAEDILDVNGTVALEKDSLLEVITLDETLTGTVSMDLPIGSYYLQEIATNEAYILDETKYPIDFTYQGQETATVEIVASNGQAIVNELQKGQVELIKESDFPTGALEQGFVNHPLEGAVYGIYSTDGKEVDRLTTDIKGYAKSELLPYGSYYLQEISAPFGYEINETEYPFTIGTDGQLISVTVLDEPKIGTIYPEDNNSNKNLPSATTGDTSIYLVGVLFIISIIILIVKSMRKDLTTPY